MSLCGRDVGRNGEGKREKGDVRLAAIGLDVAHDGLELCEDLSLTKRQFCVLFLIVESDDHVFDLGRIGVNSAFQQTQPSRNEWYVPHLPIAARRHIYP